MVGRSSLVLTGTFFGVTFYQAKTLFGWQSSGSPWWCRTASGTPSKQPGSRVVCVALCNFRNGLYVTDEAE